TIGGKGEDGLDVTELQDMTTLRGKVHLPYVQLLRLRRRHAAFHPRAPASVLDLHPAVFAIERSTIDEEQRILALHNVGAETVTVRLPGGFWRDLLTGERAVSHI